MSLKLHDVLCHKYLISTIPCHFYIIYHSGKWQNKFFFIGNYLWRPGILLVFMWLAFEGFLA